MPAVRLDKSLCHAGWGSRSEMKQALAQGRVCVSGAVVRDGAAKVDPQHQPVTLDGVDIDYLEHYTYLLYKPAGLLTATEDRHQPTVYSLLPPRLLNLGLVPVGRLDKDTTGLLLLTTDGALSHALTSPVRHVDKVYRAEVEGCLQPEHIVVVASGMTLPDGLVCQPAALEICSPTQCRLTLREGKFHQVKRMLAALGCPVKSLHRLSVNGLELPEDMAPGDIRRLTGQQLLQLRQEKFG